MGRKAEKKRIVSVVLKIVVIFTLFIMVSNVASNYINLMLNRSEQVKLMQQLLIKDLKQIFTFCSNQYEIYQFNQDLPASVRNIEEFSLQELAGQKSIVIGIREDGTLLFQALKIPRQDIFTSPETLELMNSNRKQGIQEASLTFTFHGDTYFGVYRYNPKWDVYLLRGEELKEFYGPSWIIFRNLSLIIALITLASALVGIFLLRATLKFVGVITKSLMDMQNQQELKLIDLSKAPSDDVTFLGISFNSLSSTISNLLGIFRKFVTWDVARKAYQDRYVRLEGSQNELAVLFSDIKSFTFITETLGSDIINLLNMHYDRAIENIRDHDGIIGSIIGDALLAVFGTSPDSGKNKSLQAVRAAFAIQESPSRLRAEMAEKKKEIQNKYGKFSQQEENLFRAVLLEVGVGIDGGNVFFGNIGSRDHMTHTVIGDRVNSASRLEGLTRVYRIPVVCSDFIRSEVIAAGEPHEYTFVEIDQVQVKGKTEARRIYWPIPNADPNATMRKDLDLFAKALELYYKGEWREAAELFGQCTLPPAEVHRGRTEQTCPEDWNGVWTMTQK